MQGESGETGHVLDPAPRIADAVEHFDPGPRIGRSLARLRQEVIDAGGTLCEILEPASAGIVVDAIRVLKRQVCRVAVIGQIKAGKSSFINALVRKPDLLPTDVNPWTTAVTNLHFGSQDEPEESAIFHFFAASEWERLADGGGRLRELTERLIPGFEPELLRRQLSALKRRAAARLGPEFTNLLGRHHRFATLSPDILGQYVCQGDLAALASADHPAGRYSDITKSADIYLASGPFDYPVTVIDTPGTNDPFLVRDEITRRCLEAADLYIVVLAARQALTASDVGLLRILQCLHKERIIVFLNRIDELSDIAKDTELVLASVRTRLRTEFPGAEIALIAGSARWANCALASHSPLLDDAHGRRALNYLEHKGLLNGEHGLAPSAGGAEAAAELRAALLAGSGLDQVGEALNQLLGSSHYAYVLRHMTACLTEMVRASESATRHELESLSDSHETTLATVERTESELSRLRGEVQRLSDATSIIANSAALFKERQMDIVADELSTLRRQLLSTVNEYALAERDTLASELLGGKTVRTWIFDSQPVRRDLADEFIDGFQRAEAQLLELQQDVVPHLRSLLALLVPGPGSEIKTDIVHRPVPPPRMMSLGASVALDLDESWWSLLWRTRPGPLQRGRDVERLIRTEFGRVVDELIDACNRNLTEHVSATTEWTFGICDSIARSLSRRREDLVAHYENLRQEIEGRAGWRTEAEQRRYIATFKQRLDRCEALSRILERIGRDMARDLPSAQG
jgi:uncharacterized protein YukE